MRIVRYFTTALVLASSTAFAQTATVNVGGNLGVRTEASVGSSVRAGTESPRGVVTGRTADGGIALHSDASAAHAPGASAVSGGVSLNARDHLRAQTPPHNVKMVFALNTGNYLSDVQVNVMDRAGRVVLQGVSDGPWLYAQLPAGSYTAAATYNGSTVTQKFSVGRSGIRTAQFRWPASVEAQAVGSSSVGAGGQILGTGPQEMR